MTQHYTIGLDFGTELARAVLVRVDDGEIVASAVCDYPNGVIDELLPGGNAALPPNWALQDPRDWLFAMERLVPRLLTNSGVAPDVVIGIGIDFTSCTILPTTADGMPLCMTSGWEVNPHAWPKLWKHHAAQPQADRINAVAHDRKERFINRYGGKVSSEWLIPKALQVLEEAPAAYRAADRILEGGDWIVWQLCGREMRNACAAGYKACWHRVEGYPNADFLSAVNPGLDDLHDKLSAQVYPPGARRARAYLGLGRAAGAALRYRRGHSHH